MRIISKVFFVFLLLSSIGLLSSCSSDGMGGTGIEPEGADSPEGLVVDSAESDPIIADPIVADPIVADPEVIITGDINPELSLDTSIFSDPIGVSLNDISEIGISSQDRGYANLETLVLTTQEEFEAFINQVSVQAGWNDQEGFIKTLNDESIDFTIDNLLIYQITAPTDSNLLTRSTEIIDGKITLVINDSTEALVLGTPSYIFAYKVSKILTEIVVDNNGVQTDLDINVLAEETQILTNISQVNRLSSVSGFSSFENSIVLTNQDEYDAFIRFVNDENIFSSNENFLQALEEQATDFTEKNIVIFFFVEPDGRSMMTAKAPKIIDDKVTINFEREFGEIGTAALVEYGVAYELEKEIIEVVFDIESSVELDAEGNVISNREGAVVTVIIEE